MSKSNGNFSREGLIGNLSSNEGFKYIKIDVINPKYLNDLVSNVIRLVEEGNVKDWHQQKGYVGLWQVGNGLFIKYYPRFEGNIEAQLVGRVSFTEDFYKEDFSTNLSKKIEDYLKFLQKLSSNYYPMLGNGSILSKINKNEFGLKTYYRLDTQSGELLNLNTHEILKVKDDDLKQYKVEIDATKYRVLATKNSLEVVKGSMRSTDKCIEFTPNNGKSYTTIIYRLRG